ncbi:Penicillin-binding protein 1A [Geodia barretti]|uniref:Penicillin-binding protein 1A n=1 Tax=Geodia barretti TaxID=519541 RepID=A0AA35QUD6_GEOBA|nr:Penicillin-binding protein 1A [Geodia barretti]
MVRPGIPIDARLSARDSLDRQAAHDEDPRHRPGQHRSARRPRGGAIAFVFFHYGRDLPDHNQLAAYEPPVMTRVHAGDGRLLAEHAREKRLFVPLVAMPRRVIQAFLAAEDKAFYEHFGIDPLSVANAVVTNLVNLGGDRRLVGASTITQQVAKNFLLSGELSFSRKIKEAILAMRIEDTFTKDRILELYLNEIYLGAGSYGVAAAALNYFDRSLNDLSLEEIAYLAALPKAPNNYHPVRKREAAVGRRNWVLGQMVANGAVGGRRGRGRDAGAAPHQGAGARDLRRSPALRRGAVLAVEPGRAVIGFANGERGVIALDDLKWARKARGKGRLGPEVTAAHQVLSAGDVVPAEPLEGRDGAFALRQIPAVSGALVALDPHTGRVLALVGGFDFATSEFDRATQARRQPGSAFKPFVYLAALDNGYTPASIVLDAPVVIDQGEHLRKWKPENYTERFYGPSTLRVGLEESRNLMTLRVAQDIGMKTVADYAARFGLHPDLPEVPSAALGSLETTPLDLAAAYAMLVNGGRRIEPAFVERIQDRNGRTVYQRDARDCDGCRPGEWQHQLPPALRDTRPVIADPRTTYQVVSMLEGAVQRGTGRVLSKLGAPVGGKTGTTNEFRDAWFVGFTPDLVAVAYVGFDQPQSLGRKESGGRVAAPIVRDFFAAALAGKPAVPFRVPPGIRFVRVERETGSLPGPVSDDVIVEAFLPGTEPTQRAALRQSAGPDGMLETGAVPFEGLGAVY